MRLEVNGVIVDTVELVTLETSHMGGVESKYGQDYDYQYKPRNRHAIGMKRCRFTIRKWYKADSSNTDLFYTLFDNDTEFTLKEYLTGITGFAGLEITECEIYRYTPTTGAANDIIQEEIAGEGILYEKNDTCDGCLIGEMILNGSFEDEFDGGDGNWYPTGWTCTNACGDDSGVVPPDGDWWIKAIAPNPTPNVFSIEQTLTDNVSGCCVTSATVWTWGLNNIGTNGHGVEFGVVIYYSDLTTDSMGWETSVSENQVWTERDFISCIDTTKTIVSIKIMVDGTDAEADGFIDWIQLISG
jgi:hypothetical protein